MHCSHVDVAAIPPQLSSITPADTFARFLTEASGNLQQATGEDIQQARERIEDGSCFDTPPLQHAAHYLETLLSEGQSITRFLPFLDLERLSDYLLSCGELVAATLNGHTVTVEPACSLIPAWERIPLEPLPAVA